MLHVYVQKFDVTDTVQKNLVFLSSKQGRRKVRRGEPKIEWQSNRWNLKLCWIFFGELHSIT
jgi:hypothetical protein